MLSIDPAWEHRQDGGKSFFPNLDSSAWSKAKKKTKGDKKKAKGQAGAAPVAEDVVMDEEEAALNEDVVQPPRDLGGFTEEQIKEMSGSPFRVVRVGEDGDVSLRISMRLGGPIGCHELTPPRNGRSRT